MLPRKNLCVSERAVASRVARPLYSMNESLIFQKHSVTLCGQPKHSFNDHDWPAFHATQNILECVLRELLPQSIQARHSVQPRIIIEENFSKTLYFNFYNFQKNGFNYYFFIFFCFFFYIFSETKLSPRLTVCKKFGFFQIVFLELRSIEI